MAVAFHGALFLKDKTNEVREAYKQIYHHKQNL